MDQKYISGAVRKASGANTRAKGSVMEPHAGL